MNSIRRRLLLWQISALLLTGLLVSIITYALAWSGFNRIRDYGLEQIAYTVLRHGVEYDETLEDRGQFVSQIWNPDGSLFYTSTNEAEVPPRQKPGPHVVHWQGDEWHVFTLEQGGLTIQVANTTANRSVMFARIAPWLFIPMSALVALLGLLIWMAVGRALAPLERVRREIGQRDAVALSSLDTQGLPDELTPLVDALNDLLARLDKALATQRRFVADAAHELRTPLTAIKLQAQIVQRSEGESDRRKGLAELEAGIERASHLVGQLLQMARLEPEMIRRQPVPVRLDELVKSVVGHFSAQAEAKDIDLGVTQAAGLTLPGHPDSLRILINTLVDNALRYTPTGGRVDLALAQEQGEAMLTVSDNGPGIPEQERERVFERFHRLAGADISGSGLGLAIVREIVHQHHGEVQLADTLGGGLTVQVRLPMEPK